MLITDILVHSNRRRTDAYCQGQRSECVGGWSRLFSLLGHSSSGSIQMPKSSIVWPHSNNTIVQSRAHCATHCNAGVTTACVFVCVRSCLFVHSVFWWLCVWVLLYGRAFVCVCVCLALCVCIPAACVCISRSGRGGGGAISLSAADNNVTSHWNAARQTQPKLDPVSLPVK